VLPHTLRGVGIGHQRYRRVDQTVSHQHAEELHLVDHIFKQCGFFTSNVSTFASSPAMSFGLMTLNGSEVCQS